MLYLRQSATRRKKKSALRIDLSIPTMTQALPALGSASGDFRIIVAFMAGTPSKVLVSPSSPESLQDAADTALKGCGPPLVRGMPPRRPMPLGGPPGRLKEPFLRRGSGVLH